MRSLVLGEDILAGPSGVAHAFEKLVLSNPIIQFAWPSRGPDFRAKVAGRLPSNACPFVVDRSADLREIASLFCSSSDEIAFAERAVAAAAAVQGSYFDLVDLPSSASMAHLLRPIFMTLGVGLGVLVGSHVTEDATPCASEDPLGSQSSTRDLPAHRSPPALIDTSYAWDAHADMQTIITSPDMSGARWRTEPIQPVVLPARLVDAVLVPGRPMRDAVATPSVSVVVLIAGQGAMALSATLSSLARQDDHAFEVAVVDNGSDDADILRKVVDAAGSFARYRRHGGRGEASSMNLALQTVSASVICFLRAGDIAKAEFVRTARSMLDRSYDTGAILNVAPHRKSSDCSNSAISVRRALVEREHWLEASFVIRRSAALAAGGFDVSAAQWTTLDFALRLSAQGDSILVFDNTMVLDGAARAMMHNTEHAAAELLSVLTKAARAGL